MPVSLSLTAFLSYLSCRCSEKGLLLCQHTQYVQCTQRTHRACQNSLSLRKYMMSCLSIQVMLLYCLSVPLWHFKGLDTASAVNVWPSYGNTSGTSCNGSYHMKTLTYETYLPTDTDGVAGLMFQNRGRSLLNKVKYWLYNIEVHSSIKVDFTHWIVQEHISAHDLRYLSCL